MRHDTSMELREVEHWLLSAFRDVLAPVSLDPVTPATDFFEAGGQSLLAGELLSRIREELGIRVSLRHLTDHPSVSELAALMVGGQLPVRERS